MSSKCVCGKERRNDRMSHHILEQHRENIISTPCNKKALEDTIRFKEGYTEIRLTDPLDKYHKIYVVVSFGYNCGWKSTEFKQNVLNKIAEHKEEHLKVCQELLDEFKGGVEDTSKAYESLEEKYKNLLDKYNKLETQRLTEAKVDELKVLKDKCARLERENDELSDESLLSSQKYDSYIDTMVKLGKISQSTFDTIKEDVDYIYDTYKGKDISGKLEKLGKKKKEEEKVDIKELIENYSEPYMKLAFDHSNDIKYPN